MAVSAEVAEILYPPIEPFSKGELAVSEIHTLYYEECGRREGVPVLFVHGYAGEIGAGRLGGRGVVASDLPTLCAEAMAALCR